MQRKNTTDDDDQARRRTPGNATDSRTASANQLVLERKDQREPPAINLGGATVLVTPPINEDYWLFRVRLSDTQAIVGFPKFGTIGIGFADETDWNTNLPYSSSANEIYQHIKHNKGDDAIGDADCLAAIELVRTAAAALKAEGRANG